MPVSHMGRVQMQPCRPKKPTSWYYTEQSSGSGACSVNFCLFQNTHNTATFYICGGMRSDTLIFFVLKDFYIQGQYLKPNVIQPTDQINPFLVLVVITGCSNDWSWHLGIPLFKIQQVVHKNQLCTFQQWWLFSLLQTHYDILWAVSIRVYRSTLSTQTCAPKYLDCSKHRVMCL